MNLRAVFHLTSYVLMMVGIGMLICGLTAFGFHDPARVRYALMIPGAGTVALAGLLAFVTRTREWDDLTRRDGFGIVTFAWVFSALFGSIPFMASGIVSNPVHAIFETMSGFTTTGATVIAGLDHAPKSLLLWRSLTQYLGGMGVLVLCVAILPFLGVGGMQIFRAEVPGPSKDRLTPRIATTAKLLWGIYVGLCTAEILLLRYGGMSWFDAVCHSFTTMATGGFSTHDASIAYFNSRYIEIVITIFMFLAGVNFSLHYRVLRGNVASLWRDSEFRFYVIVWTLLCSVLTFDIWKGTALSMAGAIRAAFFTGTAIMTTTGYVTADYDQWPSLSRIVLLALMFIGGCAGSTAGGLKTIRIQILLKTAVREMRLFLQPQAIVQVKVGRKPVEAGIVMNIMGFFIIYMLIFVLVSAFMCLFTPDLITAISSVATTLGNVGPGLARIGPTLNFSDIPNTGLGILTLCMLLGRLELYTVLVLLLPSFWKK